MWTLLLIAIIAGAVAYRIDSLNDVIIAKAKVRNEEPRLLSMTNPFHWAKAIGGGISYTAGYAPTAIKRTAQETKRLHLEAREEIKNGQVEVEVAMKTMKRAGATTSHRHHNARIVELQAINADIASRLV